MKKIINKLMVLAVIFAFTSCDEEDNTGHSTLVPGGNATLTIDFPTGNSITTVENDSEYPFTITISEAKPYDVVVFINQTGGDAILHTDFDMPDFLTINANSTTASGSIKVIADDLIEESETAKITIGGVANGVNITPLVVDLTILNATSDDLVIDFGWGASGTVTDNFGNEISPTALADLRLLITNVPYTGILDAADGAGFETYVLTADKPDGEYYIVADYYAAMDILTNLDLDLTFNQSGIINDEAYSYEGVMSTENTCASAYYILAKVIKSGTNYTVSKVGEPNVLDLNDYVGTWSGQGSWWAHFGYGSEIETTIDANGDLWMTGIAFQWMEGWWGEVITDSAPVKVDVDVTSGEFSIDLQYHITTSWNGAPQPLYSVRANGTFSGLCDSIITLDMNPVFSQNGGEFDGTNFGGVAFNENATLD